MSTKESDRKLSSTGDMRPSMLILPYQIRSTRRKSSRTPHRTTNEIHYPRSQDLHQFCHQPTPFPPQNYSSERSYCPQDQCLESLNVGAHQLSPQFSRSILWCSLTLTLVPMHALLQTSRRITPSFELWPTFCRRVPVLGRRGSQRSRESNRYRWYLCPSPPLPLILSRPRSRSTVGMDLRLPTSCQEKRVGRRLRPRRGSPAFSPASPSLLGSPCRS